MSTAMQGGCLCLVVLVAAVVTISASPFARRGSDDEFPSTCLNALLVCAIPSLTPYIGLNETQIEDKIRNIPLSKHCSDLTSLGDCARKEINGASCSEASATIASYMATTMEAVDFALNYICQEHFDTFDRNFRCLTSRDLIATTKSTCTVPDLTGDEICKGVNEYIDCNAGVVKTQCGEEASTVDKELSIKLLEILDKPLLKVDCSYKRSSRLALIRKFLASV
jgi:hypothetical protein